VDGAPGAPRPATGRQDAGWHPLDRLLVPLLAIPGDVLGILCLDRPRDGRRPSVGQCEVLVAFAAHLAHAVEARELVAEQERQRVALEHVARIAARARGEDDPLALGAHLSAAAATSLGFGEVELALLADGMLAPLAATGNRRLLPGLTGAQALALLAAGEGAEGCVVLAPDEAPASWGGSERAGAGPRAWRGHSVLVALTDPDGALAGMLRAARPADGLHPAPGRLRLLAAFATQAAALLDAAAAARTRAAEASARHDALHDALTGLPNRAAAEARLAAALADGARPRSLGVLCLDLDDLGLVNDSLGHAAGDELLRAVAARLEDAMTGEGFVTRLGGDAFLVVLEGLAAEPLAAARRAAERLHEALRRPFPVAGVELPLRARVGIALLEPGTSPAELLRHAVVGVSRAKHGEEATAVFVAELDDAGQRLRLATGLRRALEGDELELHFQPLRVLADGTHAGFEALVRWRPPRGALVLPGEFIGFAESSGLIEPLGAWATRPAVSCAPGSTPASSRACSG
jgi:diguanylate cyclase (GGDEF)-like protein